MTVGRRGVLAACALLGLVAAVAVVVTRGGDDDDPPEIDAEAIGMRWEEITTPIELSVGISRDMVTVDGVSHVLTRLRADPPLEADDRPLQLYRSDDSITWVPIGPELDGATGALAVDDDRLHAASVDRRLDADQPVTMLTSDDGGETWDETPLRVGPPPSTTVDFERRTGVRLASSADVTIAIVTSSFRPDAASLLPDLAERIDEEFPLDEGYVVADDDGATLATLTWDELGLDGIEDLVRHQVFRVGDDGWAEVDDLSGFPTTASSFPSLVATSEGVVVGSRERFSAQLSSLHRSSDGSTWTEVAMPDVDSPLDLGLVGDTVVLGSGRSERSVASSTDLGDTWQTASPPSSSVPSFGPLGVASLVQSNEVLLLSRDGISLSQHQLVAEPRTVASVVGVTDDAVLVEREREDGTIVLEAGFPTG